MRVGIYARRVEALMGEYVDGRYAYMDGCPLERTVSERTAAREVRLQHATIFRPPRPEELERLPEEARKAHDRRRLEARTRSIGR